MAELAKTMLKELEKNNGKEKKKKKSKEKSLGELLNLLPTSKKLSTSAKRKYPQNVWYGLNGSSSKSSKRKRNYNKGKSKLQKASKNECQSISTNEEDEFEETYFEQCDDINDSHDTDDEKEDLSKALEEVKTMVGERPKRTWGMRAERNDQRWRESKEGLLEETIRREEQETFCFKCGQREAEIRCYSCTHAIFLCTVCDTEVHKSKSFHDRQWFKEFYKPLTPKEHIEDGQVVIIEKPLLLTSKCSFCGHFCESCDVQVLSTAPITVITTKGRFDLNKFERICCHCTEKSNPFQIRTLLKNGYWPVSLNYALTVIREDCFLLWDRFSKNMPGSSLGSFLKSLSDISIHNGRVGTINQPMFAHAFKEYQHLKFDVEQLCSLSWFECPGCGDQQHSCHVDGNNKLYRYKTSGKRTAKPYYGDIFIVKNEKVNDHLAKLNYSVRQPKNSEPVNCGGNILKAAQNVSRKKASLDETGLEYCVCRHGIAQSGVNMFRGEIFGYAHYLQKDHMVSKNVKFIWYDVICKYWSWLKSNDPFLAEEMKPALSVLHGKMHQMSCQIGFGGRWTKGAALTTGEETEQVNSYLSRLTNTTKYMLPQNREDTITEFAMEWNQRKVKRLSKSLMKKYTKVEKELKNLKSKKQDDPTLIDELKCELLIYSQTNKIKEGKDKLIDDIAKLRFEIGMRKMSMGKLADSSKQRTKLRRKNAKDKVKITGLENELKGFFNGDDSSWNKYIEEREREISSRKEKKQKVEDAMILTRYLEEKKLLVEEMKNMLCHYREKLISLKNGELFDKLNAENGFQRSSVTEKGMESLRQKTISFCTQQLFDAVDLFDNILTGQSVNLEEEEEEEVEEGTVEEQKEEE
uniref:CxC3 like cysteine cluster domain-containing protein n=2 Tax=Clytia hemisphaerica TaxID=252671 RepID=A0A7M5X014_9CNID